MRDDEFINLEEFKLFLFKIKHNELTLQMQPSDLVEKVAKLVQKIKEYEPRSETPIVNKVREFLQRSSMLLFTRWELSSSFILDKIRRQDKYLSFEEINIT